jgi:1-acyl-sn-glycerol-3-phosphate acyltransferase
LQDHFIRATLFFYFSRFLIRLALPIFLRRLIIVRLKAVPGNIPILVASNHSGSFFDALVIGSVLSQPIHTLARGDVFKNPKVAFWLRQINLIPVFRGSEGRQNVKKMDTTARESHEALKAREAVVVFSEGICVHEWKLRPLGKGTARMAHQSWFGEDPLEDMQVLPTGLTYEHFRGTGKRVSLHFGEPIKRNDLSTSPDEYEKWLREFNDILDKRMTQQILTLSTGLPVNERQRAMDNFFGVGSIPSKGNPFFRAVGWLGRVIHRPLYHFFTKKIDQLTARSVFFDSALFGALVYIYPLTVFLLAVVVGAIGSPVAGLAVFVMLPLLAWMGNRYR